MTTPALIAERYRILEVIESGTSGSRFLAEDLKAKRPTKVVVKTMAGGNRVDDKALDRLAREVALVQMVTHPAIVTTLDSGEYEGFPFIVTPFVSCLPLDAAFDERGPVPEMEALQLLHPIAEALGQLWQQAKIVHRGIKPSALVITDDNQVKIRDLGAAKALDDCMMDLTAAGFSAGSPEYMSPEQASGDDLDFRSDMYSLGLVLWELLAGRKAVSGRSPMEILQVHLKTGIQLIESVVSEISPAAAELVRRMTARKLEDRYASWDECLEGFGFCLNATFAGGPTVFGADPDDSPFLNDGRNLASQSPFIKPQPVTDPNLETTLDIEPQDPNLETRVELTDVFDPSRTTLDPQVSTSVDTVVQLPPPARRPTAPPAPAAPAPAAPITDTLQPGMMIGEGYEIDRFLSKSSLGEVYLAYNEEAQQLVQIKVLPRHLGADPERRERFKREMRFAAGLKHPGILGVIGAGEESGRLFLVSEYQEGMSLADHIGRYGVLEEKDALEFAAQIADALRHAWEDRKVVHRDIRPANIQITAEPRTAKILDFGIAKSLEQDVDANLTGAGFTVGTPEYMSPEQVRGEDNIDFRSDMYSLGLLIYEALSGKKAFEDKSVMVVMTRQMKEAPKPLRELNPKVSKACADLVDRLLAKSRDQRFSTWAELCTALRRTAAGEAPLLSAQAIKAEVKAEAKADSAPSMQAFSPSQQNASHKLKEAPAEASKAPLIVIAAVACIAILLLVLFFVVK